MQGAALSGELVKPVRIDPAVCHNVTTNQVAQATGRIEHTLGQKQHKSTSLSRGKKYS